MDSYSETPKMKMVISYYRDLQCTANVFHFFNKSLNGVAFQREKWREEGWLGDNFASNKSKQDDEVVDIGMFW